MFLFCFLCSLCMKNWSEWAKKKKSKRKDSFMIFFNHNQQFASKQDFENETNCVLTSKDITLVDNILFHVRQKRLLMLHLTIHYIFVDLNVNFNFKRNLKNEHLHLLLYNYD